MLQIIALSISFVLWKLVLSILIIIMMSIFFIFALLFSAEMTVHISSKNDRKEIYGIDWDRFKFFFIIATIFSLPYCNYLINTDLINDMLKPVTRSWEEHISENNNGPVKRINISTELGRFKLLSWLPPKHFYVTLEDVKTHYVYKTIYVSKHCNITNTLAKNEEYNIWQAKYFLSNRPEKILVEFIGLEEIFC
jgi:hypothetical protein